MSRHALMMRKNVIHLEMLRGPPQNPPPNHFARPIPRHFIPRGLPMMMPHPGMMQRPGMNALPPGMMPPGMDAGRPRFPGMMGSGMPPRLGPMFHSGMPHPMNIPPPMIPHPEAAGFSSSKSHVDPRTMPPPMGDSSK